MYFEGGFEAKYFEFVGWVKDSTKFMEVMNDEESKMPSDVRIYLLDETYKQAELQAITGTRETPEKEGYWYPDYFIAHRQERLESIAKAAMIYARKLTRTKEKQMFVFGPELGGVYVFKQVY